MSGPRVLLALLVVSLSGCGTVPPPAQYERFDSWEISSLVVNGQAVDLGDTGVRELSLPDERQQMRLTIKGCETLRFRWELIGNDGRMANLRTVEAVSTARSCQNPDDTDETLRDYLRSVTEVRFEFEQIELNSAHGRMVLNPG